MLLVKLRPVLLSFFAATGRRPFRQHHTSTVWQG